MESIKLCKLVILYVLRMMEKAEFTEMKYTLKTALVVIDKLPYYNADDVLLALFEEEGGDENAE